MITGATRGGGGRKLAAHLADAKGHNVETVMGATRGLGATEIRAALRELDAGAAGGNTNCHAYHLHLDPGPAETWTDDTRREAWARLETEMGLADAPFVEVRHITWRTLEREDDLERVRAVHGADAMREKDGRHQVLMAHEHRVYDLTRDDGSVIDTAHDFARRDKVGRVFEHDHGFDLVSGRHNRAVAARLDGERPDVAAAIRAAGLTDGPRPQASISPRARAQAERTGIDPRTVGATVLAAWGASDGGAAFAAAIREQGLTLAMGTKAAVVVDGAGGTHPLARLLGKESKAAGDKITAADVAARIGGLDLPRHDAAAGAPAPTAPASTAPTLEPAGLPTPKKISPAPAPNNPKETTHGDAITSRPRAGEVPDRPGSLEFGNGRARAASPAGADGRLEDRRGDRDPQADPREPGPHRSQDRLEPASRSLALALDARPEAVAELRALAATLGGPTPEKANPAPAAAPAGATRPLFEPASAPPPQAAAPSAASLSVRPYDPTRKDNWLRFLNDSTAALNRQSATALQGPTTPGRKPDDDAIKIGIRFGEAIRDAFDAARERAAVEAPVVGGGSEGDHRPSAAGPGRGPEDAGWQGVGARAVRRDLDSDDGGAAPGPAGPPGAAAGGEQDGRPGGGDRGAPGRPEDDPRRAGAAAILAGRNRAAAGRLEIALAGHGDALARIRQKAADLRDPAAAAVRQRAAERASFDVQVTASRARIADVLDSAPWPDPADRSRHRLQDAARDRVTTAKDTAEAAAAAAAARAAELRAGVSVIARTLAVIGLETPSVQAAREADRIAEKARQAAHAVRLDYRENLAHADRLGAAQAVRREQHQQGWERRPDVAGARREAHGNDLVAAALKTGDLQVRDILREEGGLRAAREMLLRREADRIAEIKRHQLHDQRTAAARTALRPGPAAPTPGFRR